MLLRSAQNVARACAVAAAVATPLLLALPAEVSSQEALDSLQGRRVRVTLKGSPPYTTRMGTLRRVDSLSLSLRTRQGVIAVVPRSQVQQVDVSESDRRRLALRGLGIGAVVGFGVTKVWADHHNVDDEYNTIGAVILGMPLGALVGTMVGFALATERWRTVHFDIAASPGLGFGLHLAVFP